MSTMISNQNPSGREMGLSSADYELLENSFWAAWAATSIDDDDSDDNLIWEPLFWDFDTSESATLPLPDTVKVVLRSPIERGESKRRRQNVEEEETSASGFATVVGGVPHLGELDDEDESLEVAVDDKPCRSKQRKRMSLVTAPRKYVAFAIALWLLEFVAVLLLKRMGVLEHEFRLEDVVVEGVGRVLPQLNESLVALSYLTDQKKRPGFQLAQRGAKAHYPVVIIPGFVSSGLEVWAGKECAKKFFRQRLWAALSGARSLLLDQECWRQHMMLDPLTGGDPEDIRLRASQGFEAADYFMANYWVWGKLIENLADVGYTPSEFSLEPYDWRLPFPLLEERDGYFTKLRMNVEAMHKTTGKKVVLTSHSMGVLVAHYFFAWVTSSERAGGGGGGEFWVDKHIYAFVNIAGCHLGVPKALSALLSGEMSNTVFFGNQVGGVMEQFFGRRLRRDLWSSWGSVWGMLPKGGDSLWGTGYDMCAEESPDDPFCKDMQYAPMVFLSEPELSSAENLLANDTSIRGVSVLKTFLSKQYHSTEAMLDFLLKYGGGLGPSTAAARLYSLYGLERWSGRLWHDPTRTPLPYAPNMKIFCFYGTGLDTERAYYYRRNTEIVSSQEGKVERMAQNWTDLPVMVDMNLNHEESHVRKGIKLTDGDGSVPLLSLGYLCVDAWRRSESELNPSGAKVFTREYKHRAEFVVDDPMRSGPSSGEHVDILGNVEMTADFLRVVTDFERDLVSKSHIVSDIQSISKRLHTGSKRGARKPLAVKLGWPPLDMDSLL